MDHIFSQKQFFLEAFHGGTVTLVSANAPPPGEMAWRRLALVLKELVANATQVRILVWEEGDLVEPLLTSLQAEGVATPLLGLTRRTVTVSEAMLAMWQRPEPVVLVGVMVSGEKDFWRRVATIAVALRLGRVVVLDQAGGMMDGSGRVYNYLSARRLGHRLASHGGHHREGRYPVLQAIRRMLDQGVGAVSLCRAEALDLELFTYEGSGTFFAQRHYCRVRRLRFDDFARVEAIIHQGEREGFLLPRSGSGLLTVLLGGYGAFLAEGHLAGVCALLVDPYRRERAGELVSLYTLTRFQGEGVAGHLLDRIKRDAGLLRLRYLFACTAREAVAAFFIRHGFRQGSLAEVPKNKWQGYDPARREQVVCLRHDLS